MPIPVDVCLLLSLKLHSPSALHAWDHPKAPVWRGSPLPLGPVCEHHSCIRVPVIPAQQRAALDGFTQKGWQKHCSLWLSPTASISLHPQLGQRQPKALLPGQTKYCKLHSLDTRRSLPQSVGRRAGCPPAQPWALRLRAGGVCCLDRGS